MDHEYDQKRKHSPAANTSHHDAVEPGQSSRSHLLRRPEQPIASGLVQRQGAPAGGGVVQMKSRFDGKSELEKKRIVAGFHRNKREQKLREIVADTHLQEISNVCKKKKYTVGIRETGPLSVKRIKEGAKAKPHTILEKSIKDSSMEKGYDEKKAKEMLERVKGLDLDGFVGHWKDGKLIGVRVDGHQGKLGDVPVMQGDKGEPYVPLDLQGDGGGDAIKQLKKVSRWKTFLYTGDYDLHEVYQARGGGGGQIPEATQEKVNLLNLLNAAIAQADPPRGGSAKLEDGRIHMDAEQSQHAMFQHGDQATYRMNQHLEAGKDRVAELVRAVATESNEPIAWCRFGDWYVTMDLDEHQLLREHFHLIKPNTWSEEEDQRTASGSKHTEKYRA